ncbi:MAG: hypothetical protein DMG81_15785 [Acidobacteria bacterium]|nr:MAG: hypothetical protein DMG81_15785 [Acidobacteriota bacterium]
MRWRSQLASLAILESTFWAIANARLGERRRWRGDCKFWEGDKLVYGVFDDAFSTWKWIDE